MAKYRIVTFDGGGLRGLITARLLHRLNTHPEIAGWLDSADLLVGTSTGGIIALGLAVGKTPADLCSLYKDKGKKIFADGLFDNIRDFGKTIGADYSNKNLRAEIKKVLGTAQLKDLNKKVAITSFDMDNEAEEHKRTWKPKIFHNFKGADSDGNMFAADVAMYTSAAPTYFPSVDGFADGGVVANNPSVVAIAQAISAQNIAAERSSLDDIVLLSIGTGVSLNYIKGNTLDWGYAQWAKPLISLMLDGVSGIADYQARQLLDSRYHRLQIVFGADETIELDAVKKLGRMDEIATKHDISSTAQWLKEKWI